MRFRIRSLKPELFRDEKIARLPIPARYLWIGLIAHADDDGRLEGHPAALRALIFPLDELTIKKVETMLAQIADTGRIDRYQFAGLDYIEIRNWKRHQKINRHTASAIPSFASLNGAYHDEEPTP